MTLVILGVFLVAGCGDKTLAEEPLPSAEFIAEIEAYRAQRLESLQKPLGWLNLAGLYWIDEGPSSLGSGEKADIRLPDGAPAEAGTLQRRGTEVTVSAKPGVEFRSGDTLVSAITLVPDTGENPTTLELASTALRLIERNGDLALRVWDLNRPGAKQFAAIPYYPIDPRFDVEARFEAYAEPRELRVGTVIDGLDYRPTSPGLLHFDVNGEAFSLEVYDSDDSFFVIFADATSHSETYPAGRFLYTERPNPGARVRLDFNKAYNPPCAFNEFATCPIASRRNRLAIAITAGEKYDESLHVR